MKSLLRNPVYQQSLSGFGFAAAVLILDQLSKWFILEHVFKTRLDAVPIDFLPWLISAPLRLPSVSIEILPFFNLAMVWNQGISFGLFHSEMPWLLIIMALAITVLFGFWLIRAKNQVQVLALAMVIGGALGNVIDRLRFGAVADFLDFHAFGWHYPAFNLADSAITLGIAFLVIDGIFLEPHRNKKDGKKSKK